MKWLVLAVRLVLGGIFLYAGILKASASEQFALALLPFTFLPSGSADGLAVVLAAAEILAGVLILAPRVYPLGAFLIALLCVVFIAVLGWALSNDLIVDCGCFGRDEAPSAAKMWTAIGRDIALLAGAIFVCGWRFFAPRR